MKPGDKVMVYDRYRFATPLKATVAELSTYNDGVMVVLDQSNNPSYPVGCSIWVHRQQCLGEYTPAPPPESPAPAPKLSWWNRVFRSPSTRTDR